MISEQLTQQLSVIDVLNMTNVNNVSVNTIGIDMSKFKRALWIITNQGLNAAGTIDGRLQSATTSAFSSAVNLTGTNITQITTNNTITTVEIRADQVIAQNAGHRYVRLQLTGGGNALNCSVIGLGGESIQKPASQFNLNTNWVKEQVICNT